MDITKYEDYKRQMVRILIEFLWKLNALQEKYNIITQEFSDSYEGDEIPNDLVDKGQQIWDEYNDKKLQILREYCTDKVLEDSKSGDKIGKPSQFYFLEREHQLDFIMNSNKKAIIEINYEEWDGSSFGKQFTFIPTVKGWKVNCIKERDGKYESWTTAYL